MISYYVGLPGSGKTYRAVYTIYHNFSNGDFKRDASVKKDYENCYTNINEFKFDKVENVHKLDFDHFQKDLSILYKMYKKKCSDEELIDKCKELDIYKTLFVIDECHNFFNSQSADLVWWLTYHRHLYHDIILITQNLALVKSVYKPLAETFYKARPAFMTFSNKYFNYMYYTESRLSKPSYVKTIKVKKDENVFKLYKSGDAVKNKNILYQFIIFSVVLLIVAIVAGYFYIQSLTHAGDAPVTDQHQKTSIVSHSQTTQKNHIRSSQLKTHSYDFNIEDSVFLSLQCSYSVCSNNNISIPPQLVKKFIDMGYMHSFYKHEISKYLSVMYLGVDKQFYTFLNSTRSGKDENIISDVDVFSGIGSK